MSFGEELLKALSATQYRAAESPYAIAGQAVNAVTPNLVNPYGSMGSNLGIAAGSGILAALLTGLAENDATRRNTEFAPSISAFMDADPTQQAQLAAKEPRLSSLYNVLQANALTNDMELKQKIAEKTGLMPYVAEEEKQKYLATQPYKQEEDLLKQSNQLLGAEGKIMIPGQGIVDVTNPMQREADLDAMKIANQLRAKEGKTLIGGKLEQVIDPKMLAGEIKLPSSLVEKFAGARGVIAEAKTLASELDKQNISWKDLQGSKIFSGLDESGIALQLQNLADRLARARSGAALNQTELTTFNKMVGGDLSASPQQVAKLLRKLAEAENRNLKVQLDTAMTLSGSDPKGILETPEQPEQAAAPQPTGQYTREGKQIYILNGVRGVID